jgi:hypothetical protein
VAEPLSWLVLERYALGELAGDERRAVEARLAESPEDRACLEIILQDATELPPLPAPPSRMRVRTWAPLALAAAAALLLMFRPGDVPPAQRSVSSGTKGGDVAILLVSDRHGEAPTGFAAGERFKVLVTCPAWFEEPLRVVVLQDGARFEPLPAASPACGNHVPWPGAFRLDGDAPATVCLAWGPRSTGEPGERAVCTVLEPR